MQMEEENANFASSLTTLLCPKGRDQVVYSWWVSRILCNTLHKVGNQ
jgi:hypothetical protein